MIDSGDDLCTELYSDESYVTEREREVKLFLKNPEFLALDKEIIFLIFGFIFLYYARSLLPKGVMEHFIS